MIRLSPPMSLYVLAVATADGEIVWKITPISMVGNEEIRATFGAMEPHLVAEALRLYVDELRAATSVPVAPPVEVVAYGVVPKGYKERAEARPLVPGTRYHVMAMAPGENATAAFMTDTG